MNIISLRYQNSELTLFVSTLFSLLTQHKCIPLKNMLYLYTWLKEYNYKCPICREEAGEGETDI